VKYFIERKEIPWILKSWILTSDRLLAMPQKMVAEKSTRILGIFLFSADRFIQILPLGRVTLHLKIFF